MAGLALLFCSVQTKFHKWRYLYFCIWVLKIVKGMQLQNVVTPNYSNFNHQYRLKDDINAFKFVALFFLCKLRKVIHPSLTHREIKCTSLTPLLPPAKNKNPLPPQPLLDK